MDFIEKHEPFLFKIICDFYRQQVSEWVHANSKNMIYWKTLSQEDKKKLADTYKKIGVCPFSQIAEYAQKNGMENIDNFHYDDYPFK